MGRVIYLDESGVSDEKTEPWLTVGGVLVHTDTQLDKIYDGIAAIEKEFMPETDRQSGLVLHPSFIYGGNGRFDSERFPEWTEARRMSVLRALAELPKKANVLVTCAMVERKTMPAGVLEATVPQVQKKQTQKRKPYSRTATAQAVAYLSCLLECDVWLRTNAKKENCMVIVEDTDEAKAAIKQVHRYHQNADILLPKPELKHHWPLRRVREDPAFQDKRQGHPLILADFIAFVIKRVMMKDQRVMPFFDPWVERMAELSLKPDEL